MRLDHLLSRETCGTEVLQRLRSTGTGEESPRLLKPKFLKAHLSGVCYLVLKVPRPSMDLEN